MTGELILSILSGLAVCIPLVIELVKAVKSATKEKNWSLLVSMTFSYMQEAERNFKDGATKKEWVMDMIEAAADSINYEYNDTAKAKISEMIDAACDMAKVVNK